ncbi:MAG: hypothetical protein ABSB75_06805 [Candidatus Limnocylindrales bacterium]
MADGAAVNTTGSSNESRALLAAERERVLYALDGDAMTSSAIARRMRDRPTETGTETASRAAAGDQRLLFPALHGLEADWRLQAEWLPDSNGVPHRAYRKRRLLPHLPRRMGPR